MWSVFEWKGSGGAMRFWGITGTNGKTTTTWVLAEFLNAAQGRRCGYITTVEVFDGKSRFYTGYTTPPEKKLREIYAAMEANGCTDCAMEVSSHAIHQNRVGFGTTTVFSGGAFTNILSWATASLRRRRPSARRWTKSACRTPRRTRG